MRPEVWFEGKMGSNRMPESSTFAEKRSAENRNGDVRDKESQLTHIRASSLPLSLSGMILQQVFSYFM